MSERDDLTDVQWCVMDLLMRARKMGVARVSRMELLNSPSIPDAAKVKLVFAALTIPSHLVTMHGQHDFELTGEGVALYNLRWGNGSNPQPTNIADAIIYLPDQSGASN